MHASSYEHVEDLTQRYLTKGSSLKIVDIGSYDVNGSYRPLFEDDGWIYIGVDLTPGPNVNVVLRSPYRLPFPTQSIDLLVSGQAFEHIEFFWLTWLEMTRVLKPGGLIFLIAPSRGPEHQYPIDCWRFYPDGFKALARYAGLELLEAHTDWEPHSDPGSAPWGDTVGVFRKGERGRLANLLSRMKNDLRRWLLPGL